MLTAKPKARLQFLGRVAAKESRHLQLTDQRLFAERLGFIASVDVWLTMRQLRNQMVHEYIEDPTLLADALQSGHDFVPTLVTTAETMLAEIRKRGWAQS